MTVFPCRHVTPFFQVDRVLDIAALAFDDVGEEEKLRYQARIKETGEYLGYKLPQYWVCGTLNSSTLTLTPHQHIANGVKDRIEHYNRESQYRKRWVNLLKVH